MTFPMWSTRLLGSLGIPPTVPRRRFLDAWAACEGGSARYNPLNTTLHVTGSTNYNSAGVQHYLDANQGIAATLLTLRLHFYDDVRAALAAPDLSASQIAARSRAGLDKWGTGHACIDRALARSR